MELKVNGRTIESAQALYAGRPVSFRFPRYADGKDLAEGLCHLLTLGADRKTGCIYLEKQVMEDEILAVWTPQKAGTVTIALKVSGLQDSLWQTYPIRIQVADAPVMAYRTAGRTAQPENESPITIAERTITVPPELYNIAVQNDENSEEVVIVVPRYFDGHDLGGYSAILKTISDGGRDDLLLNKVQTDASELRFTWMLKPPQTSHAGKLILQIRFEGENFKWETDSTEVNILKSHDAEPVIPTTPSILDDFVRQVATLAGQAAASKDAAAASQAAAKASETNAKGSETAAAQSAADAEASNQAAKTAQAGAEKSAGEALASQNAAKTSEDNAKASETAAKLSETNAKASEVASKGSQDAAKDSEDKAKASETASEAAQVAAETARDNAQASATASEESAVKAKASEDAAKASETTSKTSETAAGKSAGNAANSATAAAGSATAAATSEANAAGSAGTASTKAGEADASAKLSKSYAVGGTGTRDGEDTDNAKYYKEQTIISTAVAQDSAQTATEKATEAATSAADAARDAASIGEAAETATAKAGEAKASAETAKTEADRAKAEADKVEAFVGGDFATKVKGAVAGNFAGLDASGNLTDSGKGAGDFATPAEVTEGLAGKQDKGEFTREFAAKRNLPFRYGYSTCKQVVEHNGVFVVTSYAGTIVAYSTDGGRTWMESAFPSSQLWADFAASDGTIVGIANDSNVAVYSADGGQTWAESTLPVSANWASVAGSNGVFVAVAHKSDVAALSADGGQTWVQSTLPSTDGWAAVAGDNGTFVITSYDSSAVLRSTDSGQTWTKTTLPDSSIGFSMLSGSNGTFVGSMQGHNIVAYSTDGGLTWTLGTLPDTISCASIYSSNGTFVISSYNSNIAAYSTDGGRTWAEIILPITAEWYSVAFNSTDIVFVAYDATICCLDTIVSFEGNSLAGKDHLHPDYAYQLYVDSLTARDVGALPISGGTLTGDLTLKKSGKNYGTKINFGNGDYVHLYEIEDDKLEIKASNLDMVVSGTATYKGSEIATKAYVDAGLPSLGDAATKNVGTGAGTVAAGDHGHTDLQPKITDSLTIGSMRLRWDTASGALFFEGA